MSLLVLNHIIKEYRNRVVLDGADLRIERGERVALVGPNGSGKTTLLRIAAGVECCDRGNVIVARGTKMGYLTQDLREMDPNGKIFRETALYHEEVSRLEQKIKNLEKRMAEPAVLDLPEEYGAVFSEYSRLVDRYESLNGYTIESTIKSMLLGLGLKEEALTLPLELLSGGEKMRVALARILLEEPDLLVLDEPTNHLDIDGVEWLEGFLKRFGGGVLVVSHDRYFLDQIATRVAELSRGTITERTGNYSTFMGQKDKMKEFARKEQFRLREEIKRENAIVQQLKGTKNSTAWKSRMKTVQRLEKELTVALNEKKEKHHLYRTVAPKMSFNGIQHLSAEIAVAHGLAKYFGSSPLFSEVNFLIRGGERVGIVGPNGCGKTTLINILLGKDQDFQGLGKLGEWVRYGYLGQEVDFSDEGRTIMEELLAVKEMAPDAARDYLAGFQFYGDEVDKKIAVLSGGERVRLYLACMILESPDCLIMDEPTNHLDVPARDALETALLHFKGTVIAISHDRYFLNRCVNRILEFTEGTVASFEGNFDAYKQAKAESRIVKAQEQNKKSTAATAKQDARRPAGHGPEEQSGPKPDLREIETRITGLEEKRHRLENSFDKDTPPERYVEYHEVIKELEDLYQLYLSVSTMG
ncbi:ABC-F family ATP-binding cassette domain-containing protein [Candidatus Formimonas warabiya]|uniref:ABC transporter domain-containing protein n=1 Tax=Formimonas warabiya TaxID=1761012 RepID=A0A3G1KTJ4_FORW1|nr:ABC-F family ATP-binding cassette domain-containing protein [Candidatus Formimonas warabiya]ATW25757.1 hypothetical protein DCMF_14185 [Candidatus Formimonas warabiya]